MPISIPPDPSDGQVAPASWGDNVRDTLIYLTNPPACSANRTTDQTITSSVDTAIQFNGAEDYDTASLHDIATNNTRFTAPTTGLYYCVFEATFNSSGTAMMVKLRVDGGSVWHFVRKDTSGTIRLQVGGDIKMNAASYVEGVVFQLTGGNVIVSNATMQMRWVGLG